MATTPTETSFKFGLRVERTWSAIGAEGVTFDIFVKAVSVVRPLHLGGYQLGEGRRQ